jgi:hypothetical protein
LIETQERQNLRRDWYQDNSHFSSKKRSVQENIGKSDNLIGQDDQIQGVRLSQSSRRNKKAFHTNETSSARQLPDTKLGLEGISGSKLKLPS